MSRTIIAIADAPNGEISMKVTHVDGFNQSSNAHKLSQQIIKFLDVQCEKKEPIDVDASENTMSPLIKV